MSQPPESRGPSSGVRRSTHTPARRQLHTHTRTCRDTCACTCTHVPANRHEASQQHPAPHPSCPTPPWPHGGPSSPCRRGACGEGVLRVEILQPGATLGLNTPYPASLGERGQDGAVRPASRGRMWGPKPVYPCSFAAGPEGQSVRAESREGSVGALQHMPP